MPKKGKSAMCAGGVYIAVFFLPSQTRIRVGSLGVIGFEEGYYFYVGSAQKNLSARIERHGRKEKPLRWHIDYLSSKADMLGAITVDGPKEKECELACELGGTLDVIGGFGASDCKCRSHLFFANSL